MRLIVDIPKSIIDKFESEEPLLLSMQQEAYLIEAAYEAYQQAVEEINEDAISRRDMALNIVSFYDKATGKKKTLDFLCKCVDSLPSMQPKQRWIPVSEKLPSDCNEDWVFAQIQEDNGYLWIPCVAEYRKGKDDWFCDANDIGWLKNHDGAFKVIAWMPLPEPYKAESEE